MPTVWHVAPLTKACWSHSTAIMLKFKGNEDVCQIETWLPIYEKLEYQSHIEFDFWAWRNWARAEIVGWRPTSWGTSKIWEWNSGKAWFSYSADLPAKSPVGTDNVRRPVPQGPRRICDGSPANRIGAIFNHSTFNMDRIVLLEYVASSEVVHIKYFYHQKSPTVPDNPRLACEVELSSTSQAFSMPRTDYVGR